MNITESLVAKLNECLRKCVIAPGRSTLSYQAGNDNVLRIHDGYFIHFPGLENRAGGRKNTGRQKNLFSGIAGFYSLLDSVYDGTAIFLLHSRDYDICLVRKIVFLLQFGDRVTGRVNKVVRTAGHAQATIHTSTLRFFRKCFDRQSGAAKYETIFSEYKFVFITMGQ